MEKRTKGRPIRVRCSSALPSSCEPPPLVPSSCDPLVPSSCDPWYPRPVTPPSPPPVISHCCLKSRSLLILSACLLHSLFFLSSSGSSFIAERELFQVQWSWEKTESFFLSTMLFLFSGNIVINTKFFDGKTLINTSLVRIFYVWNLLWKKKRENLHQQLRARNCKTKICGGLTRKTNCDMSNFTTLQIIAILFFSFFHWKYTENRVIDILPNLCTPSTYSHECYVALACVTWRCFFGSFWTWVVMFFWYTCLVEFISSSSFFYQILTKKFLFKNVIWTSFTVGIVWTVLKILCVFWLVEYMHEQLSKSYCRCVCMYVP